MKRIRQGQTRWAHIVSLGGDGRASLIYVIPCRAVRVERELVHLDYGYGAISSADFLVAFPTFRKAMREAEAMAAATTRERDIEYAAAWSDL